MTNTAVRPRRAPAARALCVLLCATTTLSGCGALLFPTDQEVEVVCRNVPGALVKVPKRGVSARSGGVLKLDRTKDWTLVFVADGYEPKEVKLVSEISVWRTTLSILLDVGVGVCTLTIFAFVGIAADIRAGSWWCLEETPVEVDLTPAKPGASTPAPTVAVPAAAQPMPAAVKAPPPPPPSPATPRCRACGVDVTETFCTACGTRVR
jgi:hypothetical protein